MIVVGNSLDWYRAECDHDNCVLNTRWQTPEMAIDQFAKAIAVSPALAAEREANKELLAARQR